MVLDSAPTANVVVTVGGHSGTDVTPNPATLTFTNQNWETARTVTVTAGNDADTANDTVSLTHSAASTDSDYSGISITGVTVTVNDNDTGQVTGVTVAPGDTELVVEWTAVSNAKGYKVQWKSGGQSYNTSTRQATIASGSTTSYTIASLTNDTEYTVQVTATRTGANDGPPSAEMTATPESVTVSNCQAGQTINPGEQCTYPGTTTTFSVAADGRATFGSSSAGSGGTISALNTTINGQLYNLVATGNSDGSWFLNRVGDDIAGTAGVTVSETALTVTEEDATGDTYTVVLDSEPTANVVVTVGGYSGTDVTPNPATLTFTNLNWETARTVTVTAGNDADTANDSVSLTHSAASTDSDYSGISIAGVTVTVNDNDTVQPTGICGRTEAVRDGILGKISSVTNCADVTADPSRRDHPLASGRREHHRPRGGGFRRADRADESESEEQLADHSSRRSIRRADRADGAVAAGQLSDRASRRGVRRADRADVSGPDQQRADHAFRRGVRRADRAGGSGAARQLSGDAFRRGVRRADRADDSVAGQQLSDHASRQRFPPGCSTN